MQPKNMTRLCCMIVPKANVQQTKQNEEFYFYLCLFEDLAQGGFQGGFYVCIK